MKKIIKKGAKLERFTLPREDAIKYMEDRNEPYKVGENLQICVQDHI